MNDLINRQDAIDLVKRRMKHNPMQSVQFIQGLQDAYLRVLSDLNRLQPADVVEVKHGEWIDTGSGQECSICKEIQYGYDSTRNYCSNCGAKMNGGGEDESL